jgi:hypothetical protein
LVACAIPRDDTKGVAVDRVAADAIILNALPSRPACAALAADTADATVTVCVLALDAAPLDHARAHATVVDARPTTSPMNRRVTVVVVLVRAASSLTTTRARARNQSDTNTSA